MIKGGDWKVHHLIKQPSFLYFAYGSCMDDARFKAQQADQFFTDVLGQGVLKGYTLRFTRKQHDGGRADIVEEGGVVEGKVYRVTPEVLPYLYKREGFMRAYIVRLLCLSASKMKRLRRR
ncbi:gamma-glutamylcyclotransferase family protein [Lentibacillus sp. JNUCC-1]|uniref:gamma-glutamylcyclotransferase family protein n=1 Tax=Lentibacillus sp. JNUCC-1 TaxID=2654513 RepID=UPI002F917C1B